MKTILLPLLIFMSIVSFAAPNQKVLKAFQATFPSADNVKWYEDEASSDHPETTEARFHLDSIAYNVWYDDDGNIVKMMRYYRASELPALIRAKVQKRFKGTTIYGVSELTVDGVTTYTISLQNDKHWLDVESDIQGNLVLLHNYDKIE